MALLRLSLESDLVLTGNEDNVICITPKKNKQGLYDMKQDLMMSILTKVSRNCTRSFLLCSCPFTGSRVWRLDYQHRPKISSSTAGGNARLSTPHRGCSRGQHPIPFPRRWPRRDRSLCFSVSSQSDYGTAERKHHLALL